MGKEVSRYRKDVPTIKIVGINIRKYRNLKGLTIVQLSYVTGLSPNLLSEYELGKVDQNVTRLKILSDKLDTPITSFLKEYKKPL